MLNTLRDFVKMLYERECGVLVMLFGCEEGGVELCSVLAKCCWDDEIWRFSRLSCEHRLN